MKQYKVFAGELLLLAQRMSPTAAAREGFERLYQEGRALELDDNQMVSRLAGALVDGIDHGNWPKPKT